MLRASSNPAPRRLRIALVAPGKLPIPPDGWGAVERLIADYARMLSEAGHATTILNTKDPEASLQVLQQTPGGWDCVHFHGDKFARRLVEQPNLMRFPGDPVVLFTSHYPFIDLPGRWPDTGGRGGYALTFEALVRLVTLTHRSYLCPVSEKDARIFRQHLPAARVILAENGVHCDTIAPVSHPTKSDRVLCLAQIHARKRQHLLLGETPVHFVGRIMHPHLATRLGTAYLGEWTDSQKRWETGHYGAAALLSENENGTPLSIKEALCGGLAVVVSEGAAHDFRERQRTEELPSWIKIVPEHFISCRGYVNSALAKALEETQQHRREIERWSQERFSWKVLFRHYHENLTRIIAERSAVNRP